MLSIRQEQPKTVITPDTIIYLCGYALVGQMFTGALFAALIIVEGFWSLNVPSWIHFVLSLGLSVNASIVFNDKMQKQLNKWGIAIATMVGASVAYVFLKLSIDLVMSGALR